MRKAIVLLLLITTMDIIKVVDLSDTPDDNCYIYKYAYDTLEEAEGIDTEDSDSVGRDVDEATVAEESLDRTADEEWLHTAVQDIAYYLRAHKFNDFDRRYHEDQKTAPRVSSLIANLM
jgi:hypothetical protein